MSTRAVAPVVAAPVAALTPLQRPMLQRTCDCGEHTGGGECDECKKKKKVPLQRQTNGSAGPAVAPPIVHDVLRSRGQALDEGTQTYFVSRLGGDFSQVRVHTDEQAAESARVVSALAYTVGNHVVFGARRYSPADSRGKRLLAHELTHVEQQHESVPSPQYRLEVGPPQDRYEREADQMADRVTGGIDASQETNSSLPVSRATARVQPAAATLGEGAASPTPGATRAAMPLLVEDNADDLQSGQMRKSDFLDKLQVSVSAAADDLLLSVGRTAQACPYLARWMNHLRTKDSHFVERGLRKYAPECAGVSKAGDYIPSVVARVQRGVARWTMTGEITGVPSGVRGQPPATDMDRSAEKLFPGIDGSTAAEGPNRDSAIAGAFAKAGEGQELRTPQEIRGQLGSGQPMESSLQSRMATAFGGDFSPVRVHTDSRATHISTRLDARAFTVGNDVAFGAGEYQPGTPIGDALIAHELAHVVQQAGRTETATPISGMATGDDSLERDANRSAAGALVSLWGRGIKGPKAIAKDAMPSLRSGWRLSRCGKGSGKKDAGLAKDAGGIADAQKTDDAGSADEPLDLSKVTIERGGRSEKVDPTKVTQGVWWLNGGVPTLPLYPTEIGVNTGLPAEGEFKFDVTNGADKLALLKGSSPTSSLTAKDSPSVRVRGIGPSKAQKDVTIRITHTPPKSNKLAVYSTRLEVRAPQQMDGPTCAHAANGAVGFKSTFLMTVKDNFGKPMPYVDYNEDFDAGTLEPGTSTEWDAPMKARAKGHSITMGDASAEDEYTASVSGGALPATMTPKLSNPQSPLGKSLAFTFHHNWFVGSPTTGKGVQVSAHVGKFFSDHGAYSGFKSPQATGKGNSCPTGA